VAEAETPLLVAVTVYVPGTFTLTKLKVFPETLASIFVES